MAALSCPFHALRRPQIAARINCQYEDVISAWPQDMKQLPLVYSPRYNITFFGVEKLHPFDSCKFSKIVSSLQQSGLLLPSQLVVPLEAPLEVLMDVHTDEYLMKMHTSPMKIAQVTELTALMSLPNWILQWRVVTPMKFHVSGTIAAAGLAMQYGWAINLGGGMHHAYSSTGMGWCPFDDIYLAIRRLRQVSGHAVKKILYIDLDAHQGNGVARDKLQHADEDLFILDVYNAGIFPRDEEAKAGINVAVELSSGVGTQEYLARLDAALNQVQHEFEPDLLFYNAGTDVLQGDRIGRMGLDEPGVVARDEAVWRFAVERARAPIVMTLSGGYAERSAAVVIESLKNLMSKFDLAAPSHLLPSGDDLDQQVELSIARHEGGGGRG